ncbi:MAG: glycosyltransferase [Proteobacteria bacterium]|nr:glycosyltransferase [Pseudomonadota bacterium]
MRTDYRSTEVFIVLPAFNEAENLKLLLPKIDATLREDGLNYQLIVVNDGSSDKTAEVLCLGKKNSVKAYSPRSEYGAGKDDS